jgi:hypothetical protein
MELQAGRRTSRHIVSGLNLSKSVTIVELHSKIGSFVDHRCVEEPRGDPGLVDAWQSFPDSARESRITVRSAGALVDVA